MSSETAPPRQQDPKVRELLDQAAAAPTRWETIELCREAFEIDQNDPDTCFQLSYFIDLVGEESEALELMEQACAGNPPHINALVNLAVLYEDEGDYEKAQRCLALVLQTDPNHDRARLFMKDVQASRRMIIMEEDHPHQDATAALLETPVTDFELSARARNCLKKMDIRTLGDLLRISQSELMAYKNFGEATMQEIKTLLAQNGLRLGQGLEHQQQAARQEVYDQLRDSAGEQAAGLLDKHVDELDLSVRSRKALDLLNATSIGDLVAYTEAELLGIKNFGSTSLSEIKQKLAEQGLGLRVLDTDA